MIEGIILAAIFAAIVGIMANDAIKVLRGEGEYEESSNGIITWHDADASCECECK